MSSPYWSRSNGKAEADVSDAKSIFKKSPDISLELLYIRNTLPRSHSFSIYCRFFIRSTLPATADPPPVFSEINHRKIASKVISNPDLTLFDAERWDLVKFDTTPFFIGYCEKECRDNTLTVIDSF